VVVGAAVVVVGSGGAVVVVSGVAVVVEITGFSGSLPLASVVVGAEPLVTAVGSSY